jgi:hypothetical protein
MRDPSFQSTLLIQSALHERRLLDRVNPDLDEWDLLRRVAGIGCISQHVDALLEQRDIYLSAKTQYFLLTIIEWEAKCRS